MYLKLVRFILISFGILPASSISKKGETLQPASQSHVSEKGEQASQPINITGVK